MEPRTTSTRRHFFWKAGAAVSAPLAMTGGAHAGEDTTTLRSRIRRLEDENAIRALDHSFAEGVGSGSSERVAELFADFAEPAVGEGLRGFERFEHEWIEIAPDQETAFAAIRCTAHVEEPIEPRCTLVEMARLQGGGFVRRSEEGVLQHTYVKRRGAWKLARSVYQPA